MEQASGSQHFVHWGAREPVQSGASSQSQWRHSSKKGVIRCVKGRQAVRLRWDAEVSAAFGKNTVVVDLHTGCPGWEMQGWAWREYKSDRRAWILGMRWGKQHGEYSTRKGLHGQGIFVSVVFRSRALCSIASLRADGNEPPRELGEPISWTERAWGALESG